MIIKDGYLKKKSGRESHIEDGYRDWWIVQYGKYKQGMVLLKGNVHVPPELIGKKIRFKVEIFD